MKGADKSYKDGDEPERLTTTPTETKRRKKVLKHSMIFDGYAVEPKPKTIAGGIITVCAWLGVIAYTIYTVYVWMTRPWVNNSNVQWTYTSGPWPLRTRCRAASGCYVSNRVNPKWAANTGSSQTTQSLCTRMEPGDWYTFDATFSNSPNDGISILYLPGTSASMLTALPANSTPRTSIPGGFGAEIESYVVCGPGTVEDAGEPQCVEGALQLLSPMEYGINLLFYVETSNESQKGIGSFRQEWYPTQVSSDPTMVAGATSCNLTALGLNSSWSQTRLRMESQFVQVTVGRDTLWIVVWGAVGGAMGLFLQIGGITLGVVSITMQYFNSRRIASKASFARELSVN